MSSYQHGINGLIIDLPGGRSASTDLLARRREPGQAVGREFNELNPRVGRRRVHAEEDLFAGLAAGLLERREILGARAEDGDALTLGKFPETPPVVEDAAVHLRRGMPVNVVIDALPEPHVSGVIHRVVPVADRRSRTVPVAWMRSSRAKFSLSASLPLAAHNTRSMRAPPSAACSEFSPVW